MQEKKKRKFITSFGDRFLDQYMSGILYRTSNGDYVIIINFSTDDNLEFYDNFYNFFMENDYKKGVSNEKILNEYNWVDWTNIYSYCGVNYYDMLISNNPLSIMESLQLISDLLSYYGIYMMQFDKVECSRKELRKMLFNKL